MSDLVSSGPSIWAGGGGGARKACTRGIDMTPRILIVEDDTSMNDILVRTLTDAGFTAKSVLTAEAAVELCQSESFELVITDVRLPGMDGVEGLEQIRALQSDVKMMVITGYTNSETPIRAFRLRVDDYLIKPFNLRSFLSSIARVLDQDQQAAAKEGTVRKVLGLPEKSDNPDIHKLIDGRFEAFRGLYILTRSGFLSQSAASEIYVKLEMLEEPFFVLLKEDAPTKTQVSKIRILYGAILDRIASFHSGTADEGPNESIQLPPGQFSSLFNAIRGSEVGLDDLQYSALLRRLSQERLADFESLLELKERLWSSTTSRS